MRNLLVIYPLKITENYVFLNPSLPTYFMTKKFLLTYYYLLPLLTIKFNRFLQKYKQLLVWFCRHIFLLCRFLYLRDGGHVDHVSPQHPEHPALRLAREPGRRKGYSSTEQDKGIGLPIRIRHQDFANLDPDATVSL